MDDWAGSARRKDNDSARRGTSRNPHLAGRRPKAMLVIPVVVDQPIVLAGLCTDCFLDGWRLLWYRLAISCLVAGEVAGVVERRRRPRQSPKPPPIMGMLKA